MKKFLAWLGGLLLAGLVVIAIVFVSMTHIHGHSYKDEAINWCPALEKVLNKEDTSKNDDIVIEDEETGDETQTEEETQEETGNETTGETTGEET